MRNLPLQFIDEKTIGHINTVARRRSSAPVHAKNWMMRVWRTVLANLDGDGPRSIANFERVMRGVEPNRR
jgi:hypothetical protein